MKKNKKMRKKQGKEAVEVNNKHYKMKLTTDRKSVTLDS